MFHLRKAVRMSLAKNRLIFKVYVHLLARPRLSYLQLEQCVFASRLESPDRRVLAVMELCS